VAERDPLAFEVGDLGDTGLRADDEAAVLVTRTGDGDVDDVVSLGLRGDGRSGSGADEVIAAVEEMVAMIGREGPGRVDPRTAGQLAEVDSLHLWMGPLEDAQVAEHPQGVVLREVADAEGHVVRPFSSGST
jgi:hypothetical protein